MFGVMGAEILLCRRCGRFGIDNRRNEGECQNTRFDRA